MKTNDSLKIIGKLQIWAVDKDGCKKLIIDDKNVKTENGKMSIANLLAGHSLQYINNMAIGDGAVFVDDLFTPIAASESDTNLFHLLNIGNIESATISVEANPIITFEKTFVSSSEYIWNPSLDPYKVVNEAALFAGDILVCHKTFASIPFDPESLISLLARWSLEIS